MRSWLLAVFVLQLLWNMAGVALVGHSHERLGDKGVYTSVSLADVKLTEGKGLVDSAHGLMDEVPELPDTLLRRSPLKAGLAPAQGHRSPLGDGLPAPWLDGVFRPPTLA
jgi:hypothetical protein